MHSRYVCGGRDEGWIICFEGRVSRLKSFILSHHMTPSCYSKPSQASLHPLQAAVNEACSSFTSPTAKATWKKWALNPANASLAVSLFWWSVAEVFRPDHPLTPSIKVWTVKSAYT